MATVLGRYVFVAVRTNELDHPDVESSGSFRLVHFLVSESSFTLALRTRVIAAREGPSKFGAVASEKLQGPQ